ncbi:MAG TPA: helix-turn-helix transcriptional regulator [Candidatus Woesebacteria bacterium]|nr:helix-turn-helix transcriptional regulator [Candidatus Woesebacteria bacterium]HPR99402.1 helix-turn-helix transcriptional regulator [Candidatus Woesebacteria bacterium]
MNNRQNQTNQNFGIFFRNRRVSLGFTLRSFCERFGYDPGNISRLERNILTPSIDESILKGYAKALQIIEGSLEWVTFFDLAHLAKGTIPVDIRNNQQMMSVLPAFYRTMRGEKLNKEKVKELIALLNDGEKGTN